jgi:hypothetical protein
MGCGLELEWEQGCAQNIIDSELECLPELDWELRFWPKLGYKLRFGTPLHDLQYRISKKHLDFN